MKNMIVYHNLEKVNNISHIDTAEFFIDDVRSEDLDIFKDNCCDIYEDMYLNKMLVVTEHDMTREEFISIAKTNGLNVELDLVETHSKYEDLKDHFGVS